MKTAEINTNEKNWRWTLRRSIASLLAAVECFSAATVGAPVAYAEGPEVFETPAVYEEMTASRYSDSEDYVYMEDGNTLKDTRSVRDEKGGRETGNLKGAVELRDADITEKHEDINVGSDDVGFSDEQEFAFAAPAGVDYFLNTRDQLDYYDGRVAVLGDVPVGTQVTVFDVSDSFANFDPADYMGFQMMYEAAFENSGEGNQVTTDTRYTVLTAQDISLMLDGESYQPEPGSPLEVVISDPAINEELNLQVWHIDDDGFGRQVEDFWIDGDSVHFLAESFSAYVVVKVTLSTIITAGDGNTYRVSVTYDQDAEMPENTDLAVRELGDDEKENYVNQSAEALGTDAENLAFARAFDISLTDPDTGMEVQPASGVRVSVSLLDINLNSIEELKLLHFGEEVETVGYTLNEGAIEFETDGFSVYVIIQTTLERVISTSDGLSYLISVTYSTDSGIPSGAELEVSEITSENQQYDEYISATAEKLQQNADTFRFAKAFDISIVDPTTGTKYQPNQNVKVSIELLDEDVNDESDISVVHFADTDAAVTENTIDTGKAEIMESSVISGAVEFETSGFSVYVVVNITYALIAEDTPFYLVNVKSNKVRYLKSTIVEDNNGNTGIGKTEDKRYQDAGAYYFEATSGNDDRTYYMYTVDGVGNKQYLHFSGCFISFASFEELDSGDAVFLEIQNKETASYWVAWKDDTTTYYLNQYQGVNGPFFAGYSSKLDDGNYYRFLTEPNENGISDVTVSDNLDHTKGILVCCGQYDSNYYAVSAQNAGGSPTGLVINQVIRNAEDGVETYTSAEDNVELTEWLFEVQDDGAYYISTEIDGEKQYLTIESNVTSNRGGDVAISSEPCALTVGHYNQHLVFMGPTTGTSGAVLDFFRGPRDNPKRFSSWQGTFNNVAENRQFIIAQAAKNDLNKFIDEDSVYRINDGEERSISVPAILPENSVLNMKLNFSETEDRQLGMADLMTYTLPNNVNVPEGYTGEKTTIEITAGDTAYQFTGTVTYDSVTRKISVRFGNSEIADLSNLEDVSFFMSVPLTVTEGTPYVDFGNNVTLRFDSLHNPKIVSKTSSYNEETGMITYTVVVTAEGDVDNNGEEYPVVVCDTISEDDREIGKALSFVSGSFTYAHKDGFTLGSQTESKISWGVNGEQSGATESDVSFSEFPLTIEHMYDGDTLTLTYTAQIDPDKIAQSGNATEAETGNKVYLQNTADSDNSANPGNLDTDDELTAVTTDVTFSDMGIQVESISHESDDNGHPVEKITWLIQSNTEGQVGLKGKITNILESEFTGTVTPVSLTVTAKDPSTNEIKYTDTVTVSSIHNPKNWTWTVPPELEGENYALTLQYTASFDLNEVAADANDPVTSTVTGHSGSDSCTANIAPSDKTISLTKSAVSVSLTSITWALVAEVDENGHSSYVITDTLPSTWLNGAVVKETCTANNVNVIKGLLDREACDVTVTQNANGADTVEIRFYYMDGETRHEGLKASDKSRTITVQIETTSTSWLDGAEPVAHTNTAKVLADDLYYEEATAMALPMAPALFKSTDSVDTEGDKPVYSFTVRVGGLTGEYLTNNALVITDTPDHPDLWSLAAPCSGQAVDVNGNSEVMTVSAAPDENGTITFTVAELPDKSGTYYDYYEISYQLTPKDDNAVNSLRQLALEVKDGETGGVQTFTNQALLNASADLSASSDFSFVYNPISMSIDEVKGSWVSYTVDINADAMSLNGGSNMVLSNSLSANQIFEASSVQIQNTDGTDVGSYDSETDTFTIPDNTHVKASFKARLVGVAGSTVGFSGNAALMNTYSSEANGTATLPGESSTGTDTPLYSFVFYLLGEDGVSYTAYRLKNEAGAVTFKQTVRSADELIVPQPVSTETKVFAGWYEGNIVDGEVVFEAEPFNFDDFTDRRDPDVYDIELYAVYKEFATVTFHGQYNPESSSSPIAYTRRAELIGGSALVEINDLSATYRSASGEDMAFRGWSYTEISTPGVYQNDNGDSYIISWTAGNQEYGKITVNEDTHLYPIYRAAHRLSYHSGPTGSGTTYIAAASYCEDEGPTQLEVPVRTGYTFQGWYTGSMAADETVTYNTPITDTEGKILASAYDESAGITAVNTGSGYRLKLTMDATLYAKWEGTDSVPWKIIIWKQKTTDAADADPKTYDFVESIQKYAQKDAVVSVDQEYREKNYSGFQFDHCDADTTVDSDGYTVLNVYYVMDPDSAYTPSGSQHTLKFVDASTSLKEYSSVSYNTELLTGNNGTSFVPDDPVSSIKGNSGQEVFAFDGWYADALCTTRVFFDQNSYDAYPYSKVLYKTMPDNDLTIYAGWSAEWYLVQIDPNYGDFEGTGGTWFWETFDGDLVREYTQVTRDYVPSSSGTYYYRKYDRAYYGYTGNEWDQSESDRNAFYTDNPGEATEDTTFEHAPGEYAYAGWYEVQADGTETPYDFSLHVDHDILLRLRWKKAGSYYLAYNAGEGVLENGTAQEVIEEAYADYADVLLTRSAVAPTDRSFVGWQIRGDDSGKVYSPWAHFTVHAEDAIRISGKEIIYLDAVYKQLSSASIVYDANGGTVSNSPDYGELSETSLSGIADTSAMTATVTGLDTGDQVTLSSGIGFSHGDGIVLAGWKDESGKLYLPGSTYSVDTLESMTFLAVWETTVTYHLNNDKAVWGDPWALETYYFNNSDNTYYQIAYLESGVSAPAFTSFNDTEGRLFQYWATKNGETYTEYDFSQPVRGALDLYACWEALTVHAVDATGEVLTEKTNADDGWEAKAVNLTTEPVSLTRDSHFTAPANAVFAFAAAADSLDSVAEDKAVTEVKYDNTNKYISVKYAGESGFTRLEEGMDLYFIYYEEKDLSIGYKSMAADGTLTPVEVNASAPTETGLIGEYDMQQQISAPLSWAGGSYQHYTYAIGTADPGTANGLSVFTDAADSDDTRPTFKIRNTWRGFEYTADGDTWESCGYAPYLYVIYYGQQPTMVTYREQTVGLSEDMDAEFTFDYVITETSYEDTIVQTQKYENEAWVDDGDPSVTRTEKVSTTKYDTRDNSTHYSMKNGDSNTAILFYNEEVSSISESEVTDGTKTVTTVKNITAQSVTLIQTEKADFVTTVSSGNDSTEARTWSYEADGTGHTKQAVFTNTRTYAVAVHVAQVEETGILCRDSKRSTTEANYQLSLKPGEEAKLSDTFPETSVYTGDRNTYAFGTILYGPAASEGDSITVTGSGVASVVFEKVESSTYELRLKDGSGNTIADLDDAQLYYLYYPMPRIRYVKESGTKITGCLFNSDTNEIVPAESVTYSHETLAMNGTEVKQDQNLEVPLEGLLIRQSGNNFRMPPILDDGLRERYLGYAKLGVGSDTTIKESTDTKVLWLRVQGSSLQYSIDGTDWKDLSLSDKPTIYAIYTERGYDLQISKTVDASAISGMDTLSETEKEQIINTLNEHSFTLTVSSAGITKNEYTAEGAETSVVTAVPASGSNPGTISLSVKDGSRVKINGLGWGEYTITEDDSQNYILSAKTGPIVGGTSGDVTVQDNSSFSLSLTTETKAALTNTPREICRISGISFYTLRSAMDYVETNIPERTATIEMVTDYVMPMTDTVEIPEGYEITLKTSESYTGSGVSGAIIKRSADLTAAPVFDNKGTLTFETIVLDGDNISASKPLIQSSGTLTLSNSKLIDGSNSGRGGAIYATAGDITINSSEISGNTAAYGGAIYYTGSGTITLTGTASLKANEASTGSGGAIYAKSGTVTLTGTSSLNGNSAENGRGGAVYAENAVMNLTDSASVSGNRAKEGGAIYAATGAVTVSPNESLAPTVSGNTAKDGSGGAFWIGSGSVVVSGGSFSGNTSSKYGGAIYAGSASVAVSGGTIGGSSPNTAKNGAAVFAATGSATFSGGSVTGNTATEGGAVGVGADTVKLYFSGTASITDNKMNGAESNVYLDWDTDTVINDAGLNKDEAAGAGIGIYVPGKMTADLFENRGGIGGLFGTYSESSYTGYFTNDRIPSLQVSTDANRKKLYWTKPIQVMIRQLGSFDSLPTGSNGSQKFDGSYNPVSSDTAISALAEDLRTTRDLKLDTAAYATAFMEGEDYNRYITRLYWENGKWMVEKRNGETAELKGKLIIYYAQPAYISIENNTAFPLEISDFSMTVKNTKRNVINTSADAGCGLVFAKNGAIQENLLPLEDKTDGKEDSKVTLAGSDSITVMLPGLRGKQYTLEGSFIGVTESDNIRVRRSNEEEITVPVSFTLNGTANNDGNTYEIIFGDDKYICKITKDGNEERFSTVTAAVEYARREKIEDLKIEMLVDYLMPGSDVLKIEESDNFTRFELTTAKDGQYQYPGTDKDRRATISRANGNVSDPLVTILRDEEHTMPVYVHDLDFDGKSVSGNVDGGAIKTKYCTVKVENSDFDNFIANNGGAVFVSYGTQTPDDKFDFTFVSKTYDTDSDTILSSASFKNCNFDTCRSSKSSGDRMGGGAIWTNGRYLYMSGCTFTTCSAGLQAGAVFHRIEMDRKDRPCQPYAALSETYAEGCTFTNCSADQRAGGGMESDANTVRMKNSNFINCVAKKSHGGGFNTYIAEKGGGGVGWGSEKDTYVIVDDCKFRNCTSAKDGGGFHSASNTTIVQNTEFQNCNSGFYGGAFAVTNGESDARTANATASVLRGVTINNCTAAKQGGGMYVNTVTLTMEDYTDKSGKQVHNTVSNCTAAGDGGGIKHYRQDNSSQTIIKGTTISNCISNTGYGGGIYLYSMSMNAEFSDTTIENCECKGTNKEDGGGGVYLKAEGTSKGTFDHCTIQGNKAVTRGGGLYTRGNLVLCNGTVISKNTNNTASEGAGVFILDQSSLTLGTDDIRKNGGSDAVAIRDNKTVSGISSNLRLPEKDGVNAKKVTILCPLSGYIGVVNAKKAGTQFGSTPSKAEAWSMRTGLTDSDAVIVADDGTLKGIIDRGDSTGMKVIWGGPPICKLTDANGNMLYFGQNGSDPAIFDRLDDSNGNGNRTSPFNLLRGSSIKLYTKEGTPYTGSDYCIKMLVESCDMDVPINASFDRNVSITFTTAGKADEDYPYEGRSGSHATIRRTAAKDQALLTVRGGNTVTFSMESIILDGNRASIPAGSSTSVLTINNAKASVELGQSAYIQNACSTGNGGGIAVTNGKFTLNGGTIRNCEAENGGGIYTGESGKVTFEAGNVYSCSATENGGGVYVGGEFSMKGGNIGISSKISGYENSAQNGGGVFVSANKEMHMSGGAIINNRASSTGGGIAVADQTSKLYFSGRVNVSGNTREGSLALNSVCNVELNADNNGIINTEGSGLSRGSYIGVYVSGEESGTLFTGHGVQKKPFGSFPDTDPKATFYCFVNDRNGLKGGLIATGDTGYLDKTIYWVQIFSLTVSKTLVYGASAEPDATNESFIFEVTLSGTPSSGSLDPSGINSSIDNNYGDMWFTPSGNSTKATVTLKDRESATAINLPAGLDYKVEEKLTAEQEKKYAASPTASFTGEIAENSARTDIDPYTSFVDFSNILPVCKLMDQSGDNLLFRKVTAGSKDYYIPAVYTELSGTDSAFEALKNADLYYSNHNPYSKTKGVEIRMLIPGYKMAEAAELPENIPVALTTAGTDEQSFPYRGTAGIAATISRETQDDSTSLFTVTENCSLTLKSIILDGNKSSHTVEADGGLVTVGKDGSLKIEAGGVLKNSKTSKNGGAVYAEEGADVTMTGGIITNNESDGNGAGIYLSAGSKLYLSGNPVFDGTGTDKFGNIKSAGCNLSGDLLTAGTNGGKNYTRAHQDIYLAETGENPSSIVLTGNISSPAGTIWVWAEDKAHYETMKPFAVIEDGKTIDGNTYAVFRNAQTDGLTQCSGSSYLSGSSGDNDRFVYWSGGYDIAFKKVDGKGQALSGASFKLYSDLDCKNDVQMSGAPVTATSADGVNTKNSKDITLAKGTVLFEKIPSGVYYMKEDSLDGYSNSNTYIVLVGDTALATYGSGILDQIQKTTVDSQTRKYKSDYGALLSSYAIFLIDNGKASATPSIADYGILNISNSTRKVILRKTDGSYNPISGAKFEIERYDRTLVSMGEATSFTSDSSGVYFVGDLTYGTYYVHETYNGSEYWFTLTVGADTNEGARDGVTVSDRRSTRD